MKEGSNCLFSSWPLPVLLHIPTHKGSKGKVWYGLQNLVWKGANQSSLCTLRRPQISAEILPRVCVYCLNSGFACSAWGSCQSVFSTLSPCSQFCYCWIAWYLASVWTFLFFGVYSENENNKSKIRARLWINLISTALRLSYKKC